MTFSTFSHYICKTRLLFYGLLILTCLSSYGQKPLLDIEGGTGTSVGVLIVDLKADTAVMEYNADIALTPASIMKSITAASAMRLLDEDFHFETPVYFSGKVNAGVLDGNIVVHASGDPTVESEHFTRHPSLVNKIAETLEARGITKINGDILQLRVAPGFDYFEGPVPTWEVDDVCWAYGAGAFDFNYSDNYFSLYPASGKTSLPGTDIKYTVWEHPRHKGLDMVRGVYSDSLIIMGKEYAASTKARVNTSMPYPFNVFKATLIKKLKEKGIEVSGKPSDNTTTFTELYVHRSPALDDILRSLMLRSDNMFAEAIFRKLGTQYADVDNIAKTIKSLWNDTGMETACWYLRDGSGLSRGNAFSPRLLGNILEYMATSTLCARYVSLFPKAGINGTMKNFMADTPLKGRLALKTGSMSGVQSYAGYVLDDDGKPTHVVVVMVNNFFCPRKDLKQAISDMLLEHIPH